MRYGSALLSLFLASALTAPQVLAASPVDYAWVQYVAGGLELRTATDARAFVRAVLDEAAPACALTLVVAAEASTVEFARFFAVLSEVANLVDKLHDVRGDRRRGEIAVRAGVRLHATLLAAFATRVARLLWMAPRPLALVVWGMRHILPPPTA